MHIAAGVGDSCTGVAVDDCVEVTGEVVNLVSAIMTYQVEATIWGAGNTCDQLEPRGTPRPAAAGRG